MSAPTSVISALYRILLIIIAIVAGLAFKAEAREPTVALTVGGWSTHFIKKDHLNYNESHELYALTLYNKFSYGTFINTLSKRSHMATYKFAWEKWDFEFAVDVGGVTGYESKTSLTVTPVIVPSVTYVGYFIQPQVSVYGNALVATVRIEL